MVLPYTRYERFVVCFFSRFVIPISSAIMRAFSSSPEINIMLIMANNKIDTATTVSIMISLFFAEEQEGANVFASFDELLVLKNLNTFIAKSSQKSLVCGSTTAKNYAYIIPLYI